MFASAFTDPSFTTAEVVLKKKIKMEYKEDVVENPEEICKQILDYYMNFNNESNEKKLVSVSYQLNSGKLLYYKFQYTGDSIFNAGVLLAAQSLAEHGNSVYLYGFDYCNPDGFGPLGGILPFKGASEEMK